MVYSLLIKAHYAWLNGWLSIFRKTLYDTIQPDARRVLIVRKGNLGDLICSFPSFEAVKAFFPKASFELLTTHGAVSSLGAGSVIPEDYFTRVYEFRSYSTQSLWRLIRNRKYDAVIELPPDVDSFRNQLRNMIFFRLAGIPAGGGWYISRTDLFKQYQLARYVFANEQDRLKQILEQTGISTPEQVYPALYHPGDTIQVTQLLNRDSPAKLAAIAVGAKLGKKKWPVAYFREVVAYLHMQGFRTIAVGDQTDYISSESAGISPEDNFCGKLSIAGSAALLAQCAFTVCNDSGPMHLSYAVGTPVCAIFSARNYRGKWAPPAEGNNIMLADYAVSCAGCMNAPCSDNICMKQITPEMVIQSIRINLQS